MLVNLARKWFAPNGALYTPKGNPHSFPDDWKEKLPKGAEPAEEKPAPKPAVPAKDDKK